LDKLDKHWTKLLSNGQNELSNFRKAMRHRGLSRFVSVPQLQKNPVRKW